MRTVIAIILVLTGASIYFLSLPEPPATMPAPLAADVLEKLPQARKGHAS